MTTTCVEDEDAVILQSFLRLDGDEGDNGDSAQKLDLEPLCTLSKPLEKDDETISMGIEASSFVGDEYINEISAKEAQKEDDPCLLLQLPTDLQADIFSRLSSFKEICLVRSVCKFISNITESSDFNSMRLGRADPEVFLHSRLRINDFLTIHKLNVNETSDNVPEAMNVQYKAFLPELWTIDMDTSAISYDIVNTCNGFFFICEPQSSKYLDPSVIVICNPVTREYAFIPKPIKTEEYVFYWSNPFGFGCNIEGKEYKVVRLVEGFSQSNLITNMFAEVYRLGDDSWKTIGIVPNVEACVGTTVFLNGVIHRMCIGLDGSVYILCFDVGSESFSSLHLPWRFCFEEIYITEIVVLRGCLCVCRRVVDTKELEIWVMMDESWTKLLTIMITPQYLHHCVWKLLSWSENKDLVFLCGYTMLVSYNLVAGTIREMEVEGDSRLGIYKTFTVEPSFGSLKDIFKGENFEIHNFRREDITK